MYAHFCTRVANICVKCDLLSPPLLNISQESFLTLSLSPGASGLLHGTTCEQNNEKALSHSALQHEGKTMIIDSCMIFTFCG